MSAVNFGRLHKLIDKYTERYIERVANGIGDKAQENFDRASHFISGPPDSETMVYTTKVGDGWEVKAIGEQVVFIEFGTGKYNYDYQLPANRIPAYMDWIQPNAWRGKYGLGKGSQRYWGFYADGSDLATAKDNTAEYPDWVHTNEKTGATVIITGGINPQRCLFNAIRDFKKEVRTK